MSVVFAEKRSASPVKDDDAPDPKRQMLDTPKRTNIDCVLAALTRDGWAPADISATSLKMLAAGLPHAAEYVSEERHETQQALLAHVRDVLHDSLGMLEERVKLAKEAAGEAALQIEAGQIVLEEKSQKRDLSNGIAAEAKENHSKQVDVVNVLEKEVKVIESGTKSFIKDKNAYNKEKDKVLAVKDGTFKQLVAGDIGNEKETKKVTDKFVKEMAKFDTEKSLVDSVLLVLSKKPEERKGFDEMVVDSVRSIMESRISCLDAALEAIDNQIKDVDSAADEKRPGLVAAEAEAASLAESLILANKERDEMLDALMVASTEVDTMIISHRAQMDAIKSSTCEVQEMEGSIAALVNIVNRSHESADATMGGA